MKKTDNWLEEVRIKMGEEMKALGRDEFVRRLHVDAQKTADEFGIKILSEEETLALRIG
jgi:hypothetical protein